MRACFPARTGRGGVTGLAGKSGQSPVYLNRNPGQAPCAITMSSYRLFEQQLLSEESTEREQLLQERTVELNSAKKVIDRCEKAIEEYNGLIESLNQRLKTTAKERMEAMQKFDEQKCMREKALEEVKSLIETLTQQLLRIKKEKDEAMEEYDEELAQTAHDLLLAEKGLADEELEKLTYEHWATSLQGDVADLQLAMSSMDLD